MKKITTGIVSLILCVGGKIHAQAPSNIVATPVATTVARFDKFELNVTLTAGFINPYDYADIDIQAYFLRPDGKTDTIDAFYMQDYTLNTATGNLTPNGTGGFHIRYTPTETGTYQYSVIATNTAGTANGPGQDFQCTSSTAKGFIRKNNTNYLGFDSNDQYIPVGENMAWQSSNIYLDYKNWLQKLSDNKGNLIRVWQAVWGLGIEWKSGVDGYSGVEKYKQSSAYYTDWLLDECKSKGVYMMLCINHHGMVSSNVNPNWPESPYNAANGGPCANTWDFFTNTTARNLHKNRLRYIVARWGYSQNIMSWELFNEVDWTDNFNTHKDEVKDWHIEMASYLKSIDVYKHLVTTSYANNAYDPNTWNSTAIDFTQTHNYIGSPNLENALAGACGDYINQYDKPTLDGEFGIDVSGASLTTTDPNGIYVHNSMWATAFSGAMGAGMSWWWDNYIDPQNLYRHFKPLSEFIATIPLRVENYKKTASSSTGGGTSDLTLTPGVGFALAGSATFTIDAGGTVTPSAAQLSNYLFGSSFNTQFRSPPSFTVTYPVAGQFKVVTGSTAGTTPKVDIYLDGVNMLEQNAAVNATYSINVPAGAHVIKVDNPGTDWISISNYVFTNIGAALNTYVVRNADSTKIAGWVHNKKYNWQTGGATPAITGASLHVPAMKDGTYTVQFTDCSTGAVTGTASATATGNILVVALPVISWDVAVTAVWSGFTTPVIDLPDAKGIKVYPNPVSQNNLIITYDLLRTSPVKADLIDLAGNRVAVLFEGTQAAGPGIISWNRIPGKIASGLYLVRINIGTAVSTQKIIITQ